jgi:hypothetical protein
MFSAMINYVGMPKVDKRLGSGKGWCRDVLPVESGCYRIGEFIASFILSIAMNNNYI